jgi:hypothetical protein
MRQISARGQIFFKNIFAKELAIKWAFLARICCHLMPKKDCKILIKAPIFWRKLVEIAKTSDHDPTFASRG